MNTTKRCAFCGHRYIEPCDEMKKETCGNFLAIREARRAGSAAAGRRAAGSLRKEPPSRRTSPAASRSRGKAHPRSRKEGASRSR